MNTAPFDPRAFRQALGSFATGVTIVTTVATRDGQSQPVGLTANSFNSVSLDPPMVLWSLAKTSGCLRAFEAAEHFAVHILAIDQEPLSNRFASRGEDKFAGVAVEAGIGGVPLLPGCSTRLQCKTSFRYEGGDHIIVVGEVLAFDRRPVAPLVFHAGRYAMATHKPQPPAQAPVQGAEGGAFFGDEFLGFLLSRAYYELYARVRAIHAAEGIGDAAFFVLTCLLARNGQPLSAIDARFALTGHSVARADLHALVQRGLLQPPPELADAAGASDAPLWLTPAGRDLALHLLAAIKGVEADVLAQLGEWEALSLKTLLRQLQRITAVGLPDPWTEAAAAA